MIEEIPDYRLEQDAVCAPPMRDTEWEYDAMLDGICADMRGVFCKQKEDDAR